MTTDTAVEATVATGVAGELTARASALGDDQSGPGPPATVVVAGERVAVGVEPVFVGRSAAMFGIDHQKVSRRHVGVQLVEGVLIATDVGSRNGTWIVRDDDRSPLTAMAVLRPGDRLLTLDDVELLRVPEEDPEMS